MEVYNFDCPHDFLKNAYQYKKSINKGLSLRAWAEDMGLKSHTLLALLLKGKRELRVQHIDFLKKGLELSDKEAFYFQVLIQKAVAKTPQEIELCLKILNDINPTMKRDKREIDEYHVLSSWVYTYCLAYTDTGAQKMSASEIYNSMDKKIREQTSLREVTEALSRLKELAFINHGANGKWYTECRYTSKNDFYAPAVQDYHQAISLLASKAVKNQSVGEREFQSFSLPFNIEKMQEAKELIRDFRKKFCSLMESDQGGHIYQFNLQFFRLTQAPLGDSMQGRDVCTEGQTLGGSA